MSERSHGLKSPTNRISDLEEQVKELKVKLEKIELRLTGMSTALLEQMGMPGTTTEQLVRELCDGVHDMMAELYPDLADDVMPERKKYDPDDPLNTDYYEGL